MEGFQVLENVAWFELMGDDYGFGAYHNSIRMAFQMHVWISYTKWLSYDSAIKSTFQFC